MTFRKWIELQGGAVPVAQKLGVTPSCVRYWLRRNTTPRGAVIQRIMKASKGKVSMQSIVGGAC